jgi:hypothetical protein
MFRPFLIRPSSGRKFFVEKTVHFIVQFLEKTTFYCTVSLTKNLRPDDGLIKKGRNMYSNKKTPNVVFDLLLFITNIRYKTGIKVNQSPYRPEVAQRVPGS